MHDLQLSGLRREAMRHLDTLNIERDLFPFFLGSEFVFVKL